MPGTKTRRGRSVSKGRRAPSKKRSVSKGRRAPPKKRSRRRKTNEDEDEKREEDSGDSFISRSGHAVKKGFKKAGGVLKAAGEGVLKVTAAAADTMSGLATSLMAKPSNSRRSASRTKSTQKKHRSASRTKSTQKKHRSSSRTKSTQKKHLSSSCTQSTQKKYESRPSPPYPANSPGCRDEIRKGNNGRNYKSKADKNGVYRWYVVAAKK